MAAYSNSSRRLASFISCSNWAMRLAFSLGVRALAPFPFLSLPSAAWEISIRSRTDLTMVLGTMAVGLVVGVLNFPPALGLLHGRGHGGGHPVGVEDDQALGVSAARPMV